MNKKDKKKIFIISNSTFQLTHYYKFKIKELLKKYEVYIIDLTKYYDAIPKFNKIKNFKNYIQFSDKEELFKFLVFKKPNLIIDILGNNFLFKTWSIRSFFFNTNQNTLILNRGIQPKIVYPFFDLIKIYFKNPKYFYKSLVNFILKRIIKIIFKNVVPDYFVSSGLKSDHQKYKKKKYFLYSYDYENYLNDKKKKRIINEKYALFIDENIIYHPDYFNSNYPKVPATEKRYYKSLKSFFSKFEKINKVKVIIALHPTTNKKIANNFKPFKKYYNLTGRLLKDTKFVLIHSSTTKHIAAVYKKPLLFLTTDEINKSWFFNYIKQNSELFNSKIINVDEYDEKIEKYKIEKNKYSRFIDNYVVHPKFKYNKKDYLKIINKIMNNE